MPTEFTRTVEAVEQLEKLATHCSSAESSSGASAETDGAALREAAKTLAPDGVMERTLAKFRQRSAYGLYNDKMAERIVALAAQVAAIRATVQELLPRYPEAATAVAPRAPQQAPASATPAVEPPAKKQRTEDVAHAAAAAAPAAASPAPAHAATAEQPHLTASVDAEEHAALKKTTSYRIPADLVETLANALGFPAGHTAEMTVEEAEQMLKALALMKLGSFFDSRREIELPTVGPTIKRAIPGWRKWAEIEARAAFVLLDKDSSGTVSRQEFVEFIARNPQLFGPLCQIERLFRAYDENADGKIDLNELLNLLVEVEVGTGKLPPDEVLAAMQSKALKLLRKYDRDKSGTLEFIEFATAVYDDPSLLGTVTFLRQQFLAADTNGDGELSKDEVASLVRSIAAEHGLAPPEDTTVNGFVAELFEGADTDNSGTIDLSELMAYARQENAAIQLLPFLVDPTAVFGLVDAVRVPPATATSEAAAAGGHAAPSKAHGEQHDEVFKGSFVQKLLNQTQAAGAAVPAVLAELGLSADRKTLSVAACCSCQAPLVGRLGITKLGMDFCNNSCLNRNDPETMLKKRQEYLGKYSMANARGLTHADYGWHGFKQW